MDEKNKLTSLDRRAFVQFGAVSALAWTMDAQVPGHVRSMIDVPFAKRNPKIAMIGTGGRGTALLGNLLLLKAQIVAICDVVKEHAENAAKLAVKAGLTQPELYTSGPTAYEEMLKRKDIDFVVIATPWLWHAPMAIFAMQQGKDVAVEVPAVTTIEDCWKIVNTSEQTGRHCMMLENCCYGYNETLVLRMVQAGVLGDLLYGEGGYLHDLRQILFADEGEGLWRRDEHTKRNGNLYPTHGLGPVANYMRINRGDYFSHLVSMSSRERSLDQYRKQHLKPADSKFKERYVEGDMNTSLIKTGNGLTITVKHTVSTPRPYDRINCIAGTQGIFEDYPPRIYVDGQTKGDDWGSLDVWKKYEHPLWTNEGDTARNGGGHGGMDYIMLYRLMQCLREGLPPDMDVYDAAAWSSVGPLSEVSVEQRSAPVDFPDFTRGKWSKRTVSAIATQV